MFARMVLALVAVLTFSQAKPQAEAPLPYTDHEAYEVYSTILPKEWSWRVAKDKLVIATETIPGDMCLYPIEESKTIVGPAIADYKKRNAKTWLLERDFKIEKPYALVSRSKIKEALKGSDWQAFYTLYGSSGGYIWLSAVGFNADKTNAVVSTGHSCGLLCGGGGPMVLQKKDGRWQTFTMKGGSCGWGS